MYCGIRCMKRCEPRANLLGSADTPLRILVGGRLLRHAHHPDFRYRLCQMQGGSSAVRCCIPILKYGLRPAEAVRLVAKHLGTCNSYCCMGHARATQPTPRKAWAASATPRMCLSRQRKCWYPGVHTGLPHALQVCMHAGVHGCTAHRREAPRRPRK